jgi:protein-disulfide isomerase
MSLNERLEYVAMKARHGNLLKPWYRKWWGVLVLIILGLVLAGFLAAGIYVVNKIQEIRSGNLELSQEKQWENYLAAIYGDKTNYYLGQASSSVTIVEFSDFACPYCQKSAEPVRQMAEKYQNKIKIIYRDFPIHENSIDLALAARCAGEQNKFWEMHDVLFANQDKLTATSSPELKIPLLNLASDINLGITQFTACFDERRYISQIKKDYEDGTALNLAGTPTWYVNNYALTGSLSADKLEELITGLVK